LFWYGVRLVQQRHVAGDEIPSDILQSVIGAVSNDQLLPTQVKSLSLTSQLALADQDRACSLLRSKTTPPVSWSSNQGWQNTVHSPPGYHTWKTSQVRHLATLQLFPVSDTQLYVKVLLTWRVGWIITSFEEPKELRKASDAACLSTLNSQTYSVDGIVLPLTQIHGTWREVHVTRVRFYARGGFTKRVLRLYWSEVYRPR
jgi:hypothetical protein